MDQIITYHGQLSKLSAQRQFILDLVEQQISLIETLHSNTTSPSVSTVAEDDSGAMETLLHCLLRSEKLSLAACMKARRDYNVGVEVFLQRREECIKRLLKNYSEQPSAKRVFRDYYKAMRDIMMPSLHNAMIVYSSETTVGLLCSFTRNWVEKFMEKGSMAIEECRDVIELNSLWTQCVLLNNMMAKHGVAFMPILEEYFIQKAVKLCNDSLHTEAASTMATVDRACLSEEHKSLPFLDHPENVALVNSVIDALNSCRHFAHPLVLRKVSESIMELVCIVKNKDVQKYVVDLLRMQNMLM